MGQEILFRGQSTSGSILTASRIISRLTGVSPSTFASEMLFTVTLNNVEKDVLILLETGQLRLHNYTTSTSFASVSGASVGVLNVDNQGQVFVGAGGGGGVQSVTGLDTDNTDPANPVIQIAVDGVTITGDGTAGNPLVGASSFALEILEDGVSVDANVDEINFIDAKVTQTAAGKVDVAVEGYQTFLYEFYNY
jgi:hypothetical protein